MTRGVGVPIVVLAVGAAGATVVALTAGTPVRDAAVLLGYAAVASLVVAALSRWLLRRRGASSLRGQILALTMSSIATVVAGTLTSARAMFISVHDLNALLGVMTVAVAVSVAASLHLASHFNADAEAVTSLAQQLVDRPPTPVESVNFASREMRDLGRRLEEISAQLDESRRRELALDQSRRELVSWVSHDLRSPIASIRALAEALEDGIADDDTVRARYFGSILRESERLTVLVNDLFELSRIQSGVMTLATEPVRVHELVDDAVSAISHYAEITGVQVACDIAAVDARIVTAGDVTRALRNLLDNAIRHTRAGGSILLEGYPDGDSIVLSVLDECGGIPDADIGRVFDTAFRGDIARGRDGGGGGLGLAIARGLVESHSGQIDVRNHGAGCQFRIRIPAIG